MCVFPLGSSQWWRRTGLSEGTSEIQQLVIARAISGLRIG
jgi:hypothetical protein